MASDGLANLYSKDYFSNQNTQNFKGFYSSCYMIQTLVAPIRLFYAKLSFVFPIFQANNATLNVRIGPTVKAARNVATVKTEAVVTTFQELVLAHQDGKELCKFFFPFS